MTSIKTAFPEEIAGEGITLRKHPATKAHAAELLALASRNREHIGRWRETILKWKTEADCLDFLREADRLWKSGKKIQYAIFSADGALMGDIKTEPDTRNSTAEIGFFIGREFTRKGYVQEAIRLLEDHLFNAGFWRVEMDAEEGNEASQTIILKTGHAFEGAKLGARQFVTRPGHFYTMMFSKLRREWERGRDTPRMTSEEARAKLRAILADTHAKMKARRV
ncbi:MAG: GNAT family N-acetyltransferase [Rickettsiales bacterium]|jgi:ribosomal-protein-serine acetyltransferase|nr:GNAT family N-acetyltransferase [Rickettsiales bacterium]